MEFDIKEGTSFVSTLDSDGVLTVFNTELALVEILVCNFKQKFEKPIGTELFEESKKMTRDKRGIMAIFNQDSDEDDV